VKLTCDQEQDAANPEAEEDQSAPSLTATAEEAGGGGGQGKGERRFRAQRVETPSHPGMRTCA
jgi:pre-mRNA-splicing factor ATP-dependent RNA helicase DHX38/PRP16